MEKLYLDLPAVSAVDGAFKCSSQDLMSATGANIGNLAFRHALKTVVAEFPAYRAVRYPEALANGIDNNVERVLVSCANWLGTSASDEAANENRSRTFEGIKAPVTCFGIGVQARHGDSATKLGPHTLRLAKVLAERGRQLSVRDQRTQDTLESEGITNTVVTGCPSNFINPDPTLGATIAARAKTLADEEPSWARLRIAISEMSGGHPVSGKIVADHLRLMNEAPAFYVIQSPDLLAFTLGENGDVPRNYQYSADPFGDQSEVARVLKSKTLHFSSMEEWLNFSASCALSFGMRIHGTMVPLQAGVPSLLIGHDTRTSGLGQHMGIPHVLPEVYLQSREAGPKGLFGIIADVMARYDARRAELATVMIDYVNVSGLTPHEGLHALAAAEAPARAAPLAS